jgi:hypothetical protein
LIASAAFIHIQEKSQIETHITIKPNPESDRSLSCPFASLLRKWLLYWNKENFGRGNSSCTTFKRKMLKRIRSYLPFVFFLANVTFAIRGEYVFFFFLKWG